MFKLMELMGDQLKLLSLSASGSNICTRGPGALK